MTSCPVQYRWPSTTILATEVTASENDWKPPLPITPPPNKAKESVTDENDNKKREAKEKPPEKRELIYYSRQVHGISIRTACRIFSISRTVYLYQPDKTPDEPVIRALQERAERYPRYGFGKMFPILRRHGHRWNHKRVYRVYCDLKLNMRYKGKKRLPNRNPEPLIEYSRAIRTPIPRESGHLFHSIPDTHSI